MRNKIISVLVFILLFLNLSNVYGQLVKYSNDFLNIGVGAAPLALGKAVVAGTDNVYAAFWNPSGLSGVDRLQVAAMHTAYFAAIAQHDFLAVALPVDSNWTFALSLQRLSVDNIQNTLNLVDEFGNIDYNRIELFSVSDNALFLSASRRNVLPGLNLGGSIKLIYRHQGAFAQAYGFGLDAGLQYRRNGWQLGAMLQDISTTFNFWTFNTQLLDSAFAQTGNTLPEKPYEITLPAATLGVGRVFKLNTNFNLHPELAFYTTFDGKRNALISASWAAINPRLGLGLDYQNKLHIRLGASNFQHFTLFDDDKRLSFSPALGLGINLNRLQLDYAHSRLSNAASAMFTHHVSLLVRLSAQKSNLVPDLE